MTDKNLQKRAGLNIGTEPSGGVAVVDKAIQNVVKLPKNSEVTVLRPSPNNNRLVPGVKSEYGPFSYFYGTSDTATPTEIEARWYNEFDESIDLGFLTFGYGSNFDAFGQFMPPAGFLKLLNTGWMTMAPGERLTLKSLDSDATVFLPTTDLKRKPKPSGGGGASDGNVITVRGTVTSQGLLIGPPPGRAWGGVSPGASLGINAPFSVKLAHFGAETDEPVNVKEYIVTPDGTEYFSSDFQSFGLGLDYLEPQSFGALGFPFVLGGYLAYPNKWLLKLDPAVVDGSPVALPQGRIQLLATLQEFDLPADAT